MESVISILLAVTAAFSFFHAFLLFHLMNRLGFKISYLEPTETKPPETLISTDEILHNVVSKAATRPDTSKPKEGRMNLTDIDKAKMKENFLSDL